MGVDTVIVCQVPVKMTARQLRVASVKLATAFGADNFSIWHPGDYDDDGHHALTIAKPEGGAPWPPLGWPKAPAGGCLVECHLRQSYYGPGYERGDFALIMAVLEWLEREMPAKTVVYYGGDTGEALDRVTAAFGQRMWAHFQSPEGRSYYVRDRYGRINCEFCDVTMYGYGTTGGMEEHLFYCAGCGRHEAADRRTLTQRRPIEEHRHYGASRNAPVPKREILAELLRVFAAMTLEEAEVTAASVHEERHGGRMMTFDVVSRWHLLTPDQQHAARERAITLLCTEAK